MHFKKSLDFPQDLEGRSYVTKPDHRLFFPTVCTVNMLTSVWETVIIAILE